MKEKSQSTKLKNLADQAFTDDNFDKAIDLYSKALTLDSTNPALYNNKALSHFRMGNFQESLKDAEAALRLDPKFVKAHVRIIETYIELGEAGEAKRLLENAILELGEIEELQQLGHTVEEELTKTPAEEKWSEMVQWLKKGGGVFDKLMVAEFSQNYRGIMAKRNINKKERILYIPRGRLITLEMARELRVSRTILEGNIELMSPKHTFLALFLLEERIRQKSQWKPYIDLLPTEFPSFPIFYTNKELEMLEGSPFLFMVHEKVLDLKKDYDTICRLESGFSTKFEFKQFCWARTAVCSRIFGVTIDGNKTDALVPFADMINHRIPKQSSWVFSQNDNGFVMEAITDIERGQEVFDSYGKKCNSRFLLNYGFVIPNNETNEVSFKVTFDNKDPLMDLKAKLVGKNHLTKIFKTSTNSLDSGLMELLGFLRFRFIHDEVVFNRIKTINNLSQTYSPSKTPPIDKRLQQTCWRFIHESASSALLKYKTSLLEDSAILTAINKPTQNELNCLILRMGEKQLYTHFSLMAQKMVQLLDLSVQQLKEELTKEELVPYLGYIQKVLGALFSRE